MSTRCLIGKENKDKSVTFIYCHHDGYISNGVGQILEESYTDESKVDALMKLGNLSALSEELVDCDSYASQEPDDAELAEREAAVTVPLQKYLTQKYGQEYYYLFRDGKWHVALNYSEAGESGDIWTRIDKKLI